MDIVTLEIFRTVAAELSITRAAAQLGRVQSNVTTRIQSLEGQLGVALFNRDNKKLRLTDQGQVFLQYAHRLLALANEAQQAMHPATPQGTLRLGSMESTAASRLPVPLSQFHQASPGVILRVTTGPSQRLIDLLDRGEIDCALLAMPYEGDDEPEDILQSYAFAGERAYAEVLRVVLPKGCTPGDLLGQAGRMSLAAFQAGCSYRQLAGQWLAAQGSGNALDVHEVGSYHAMLACVAAGQSFSVIPQSVLQLSAELASVELGDSIPCPTWLVWRAGYSTAAFDAFRAVLRHSYSPNYQS